MYTVQSPEFYLHDNDSEPKHVEESIIFRCAISLVCIYRDKICILSKSQHSFVICFISN